jgi:hypothetical protein
MSLFDLVSHNDQCNICTLSSVDSMNCMINQSEETVFLHGCSFIKYFLMRRTHTLYVRRRRGVMMYTFSYIILVLLFAVIGFFILGIDQLVCSGYPLINRYSPLTNQCFTGGGENSNRSEFLSGERAAHQTVLFFRTLYTEIRLPYSAMCCGN